jgi:hypothetical protein
MTKTRVAQGCRQPRGSERYDMSKISDLEREQTDLETDMVGIRGQLSAAMAQYTKHGEYADPVWFQSAKHALRMKGLRHQQVQRELAALRRLEKRSTQSIADHFLTIAREQLEPDDFREMWDEALERKERADAAVAEHS